MLSPLLEHVTRELTSNITHQRKTQKEDKDKGDISRNGTRKTIEDKREDNIKDNAILCGHKEQSMHDISRKGTRWTFEDNKEEDIKDDAQYTVYPAQRDMVNRNNITVGCGKHFSEL